MSNDTKWYEAWAESIVRYYTRDKSPEWMAELQREIVQAMIQAQQREARRHISANIIANENGNTFQRGYHDGYKAGLQDGLAAASQDSEPLARAGLCKETSLLVCRFADALADKLAASERKYGYSDDWLRTDWMDQCRENLVKHVQKGDPLDVAAYCAFLWHHGQTTTRKAPFDHESF